MFQGVVIMAIVFVWVHIQYQCNAEHRFRVANEQAILNRHPLMASHQCPRPVVSHMLALRPSFVSNTIHQ